MNIVQVASEFSPLVSVGNIADAVGGLTRALARRGHHLTVFLPGYRSLMENPEVEGIERDFDLSVEMGSDFEKADVFRLHWQENITVYLVGRDEYFDRSYFYGNLERPYDDNDARFIFFSKAVVECLDRIHPRADILHCHDWTTALVPLFLRYAEGARHTSLAGKSVFTIHNIHFQGIFPGETFALTNLPDDAFTPEGLEFYGQVNFLKGGLYCGDHITTVSPNYAWELLAPEGGAGLDGSLANRADSFAGIVHGLEMDFWNPAEDATLAATFTAADPSGRAACRRALLASLGREEDFPGPLFLAINPFHDEVGETFLPAVETFFNFQRALLIIVGTIPSHAEEIWADLAAAKPRRVFYLDRPGDARLGQLIAGSDFYLALRGHQPCGFNQMVAQRYGTLPVAPRVGGLVDTIEPLPADTGGGGDTGTGILFDPDPTSLTEALLAALKLHQDPPAKAAVIRRAMLKDFSWDAPAQAYEELYEELV